MSLEAELRKVKSMLADLINSVTRTIEQEELTPTFGDETPTFDKEELSPVFPGLSQTLGD